MAGTKDTRRDDWGCESGYCREEEEEWFLEGFHLDCFRCNEGGGIRGLLQPRRRVK